MANFRQIVNQRFSAREETTSRDLELVEDSQDPNMYESQSQSILNPSYGRSTSTPLSGFYAPPRFPFMDFATPFIRPSSSRTEHSFAPSFLERNYNQRPNFYQQSSATMSSPATVPSADTLQKERVHWTTEQTDALVNAWQDAFVELESHKNPQAWKRIMAAVNKAGKQRSLDQIKKKLNALKDKYKEAKAKNKKSGEARNMPKYYDTFDEILGTRSIVQFEEVREAGNEVADGDNNKNNEDNGNGNGNVQLEEEEAEQAVEKPQPRRKKKKKASKAGATSQLVECLASIQQQKQNAMSQFLEGMKEMEENSRRHTSDVLLQVAEMFRNRKRHTDDSDSN